MKSYEIYDLKDDVGIIIEKIRAIEDKKSIEKLMTYVSLLEKRNVGFMNILKMQCDMFETVKEEDGKHTLTVSHDVLIKLKKKNRGRVDILI